MRFLEFGEVTDGDGRSCGLTGYTVMRLSWWWPRVVREHVLVVGGWAPTMTEHVLRECGDIVYMSQYLEGMESVSAFGTQ